MQDCLNQAIAEKTVAEKMGLPPLLLAALPVREAITLNHDTAFEEAREAQ